MFEIRDNTNPDHERIYHMDVTTGFRTSLSKTNSITPLTSKSSDCTFVMEMGSSRTYSVDFVRVHPQDFDDDSEDTRVWSNRKWMCEVKDLTDRWQARFNGYEAKLSSNGNPNVPEIDLLKSNYKVFISSITFTHKAAMPDTLFGTMNFKVGLSQNRQDSIVKPIKYDSRVDTTISIPDQDFRVMISDAERKKSYIIQQGSKPTIKAIEGTKVEKYNNSFVLDCVESYQISGGPEQPFESAEVVVSHKKLKELYGDLVGSDESGSSSVVNNIISGQSMLSIHGIGDALLTISKCRLSKGKYRITAYANAAVLKGYKIHSDGEIVKKTPWNLIRDILTSGKYGVSFLDTEIIRNVQDADILLTPVDGAPVWSILQICAMYLGAKIFFAENRAYVISYLDPSISFGRLDLNPLSEYEGMKDSVIGEVSLGDEGIDTIQNLISATYKWMDTSGESAKVSVKESLFSANGIVDPSSDLNKQDTSVLKYGVHYGPSIDFTKYFSNVDHVEGSTMTFDECWGDLASKFCMNKLRYLREPNESITFEVKERYSSAAGNKLLESKWRPTFPYASTVSKIVSEVEGVYISNESSCDVSEGNPAIVPSKISFSTYRRRFPEGTTEYTFGRAGNVDLSQFVNDTSSGLK